LPRLISASSSSQPGSYSKMRFSLPFDIFLVVCASHAYMGLWRTNLLFRCTISTVSGAAPRFLVFQGPYGQIILGQMISGGLLNKLVPHVCQCSPCSKDQKNVRLPSDMTAPVGHHLAMPLDSGRPGCGWPVQKHTCKNLQNHKKGERDIVFSSCLEGDGVFERKKKGSLASLQAR